MLSFSHFFFLISQLSTSNLALFNPRVYYGLHKSFPTTKTKIKKKNNKSKKKQIYDPSLDTKVMENED